MARLIARRLSTACIAQLHGGATPTVAAVFDMAGELAACVADVSLLEEQLTPQLLRSPPVAAALAAAPIVMLDGNLSPEALQEACRQAAAAGVPVWFEPVSAPKSVRAAALLHRISFVSPNRQELAAMAAALASSSAGAEPGAQVEGSLRSMLPDIAAVLGAGVQHVVLTLGPGGAALCRLEGDGRAVAVCHMPALPAAVLSCSGAGDCLVAGCLFALARGLPAEAALAHGIAASKAAVESVSNVPPSLSASVVMRDAAALLTKQATRLRLPLPSHCCNDCAC
ncbi:Pseudouridine kinase [Chlorella vulgaris]